MMYSVAIREMQTSTPWRARRWEELVRTDATPWTSASAIEWAHHQGHREPGTEIKIERARGNGPLRPYRAYIVGADGIVRRTDR